MNMVPFICVRVYKLPRPASRLCVYRLCDYERRNIKTLYFSFVLLFRFRQMRVQFSHFQTAKCVFICFISHSMPRSFFLNSVFFRLRFAQFVRILSLNCENCTKILHGSWFFRRNVESNKSRWVYFKETVFSSFIVGTKWKFKFLTMQSRVVVNISCGRRLFFIVFHGFSFFYW